MPIITKEYSLELLTATTVTVIEEQFIQTISDSKPIKFGEKKATAYTNRASNREILFNLLPEKFYNAIISVWGAEPTVSEPERE